MQKLGVALVAIAMISAPVWVSWLMGFVIPFISNPVSVFVILMATIYGLYALFAFIYKENSNGHTEKE